MNPVDFQAAIQDFRRARQRAAWQQVLARLQGEPDELLAYEDVRKELGVTAQVERGLHDIPVEAIVGSVGRHQDFTGNFLPKRNSTEERWARVKAAMVDMTGLPPIDVYRVGDVYFVRDGNHRVSIAREMGTPTISAYVTEVKTRVPIQPGDDPDRIISKARYAKFLERTNLDKLRPEADLLMTIGGQYRVLLEHIKVHHYFMGVEQKRDITYDEAVAHWYDTVYVPMVQLIREQGVLHYFPERTETDLYFLLAEYRQELREALGWEVDAETAVSRLPQDKGGRSRRIIARVGEQLRDVLTPDELELAPPPGEWRESKLATRHNDRLFIDILVAINGTESGWGVFDHALRVAQYESGRLLGLHVVSSEKQIPLDNLTAMRDRFEQQAQATGVEAKLSVQPGQPVQIIVPRTQWADLVVAPLTHPPDTSVLSQLSSGFINLLQRVPRPVLAVPSGANSALDRVLLAYDGSRQAKEALYVSTYLAARWGVDLMVITVQKKSGPESAILSEARTYLEEHGVDARYEIKTGEVASAILETAEAHQINLLVVGGFRGRALTRVVLGSVVNEVLRAFHQPILICR